MTPHFSLARSALLTPFGLTDASLTSVLSDIQQNAVDDADLYFQTTRSEGWSLEEGIVKTGNFSIDQGVGVRAVSGEKTAFAYSDDISLASLMDAASVVRSIGAQGKNGKIKVDKLTMGRATAAKASKLLLPRKLYGMDDPIASQGSAEKVALLEKVEKLARSKDPRVKQVMAGIAAEHEIIYIARSNGQRSADVRPLVRLSVTVIAEQTIAGKVRRETGTGGGSWRR